MLGQSGKMTIWTPYRTHISIPTINIVSMWVQSGQVMIWAPFGTHVFVPTIYMGSMWARSGQLYIYSDMGPTRSYQNTHGINAGYIWAIIDVGPI